MWKSFFVFSHAIISVIGYRILEIPTPKIALATRPVWVESKQSLYFINFLSNEGEPPIYRYSLSERTLYAARIPGVKKIGFIYPVNCANCNNVFAIGNGHGVDLITWDGISSQAKPVIPETLFSLEINNPSSGTDIVAADPYGRFYLGTYSAQLCKSPPILGVYKYQTGVGVQRISGGIYGSSGLSLDPIARKLYHLEYCQLLLGQLDWDPATGAISNYRVAFDFKTIGKTIDDFIPVGLAVDKNGLVYTTDFKRSIYIINPRARNLVNTIDVGVTGVNGLAFGGSQGEILFVTASENGVDTEDATIIDRESVRGSSIYAITGLNFGQKTSNFKVGEVVY